MPRSLIPIPAGIYTEKIGPLQKGGRAPEVKAYSAGSRRMPGWWVVSTNLPVRNCYLLMNFER